MTRKRHVPTSIPIAYKAYHFSPARPVLSFPQTDTEILGGCIGLMHFHNYMELGRCLDGSGSICTPDEEISFQKGDYSLVCPGIPHRFRSDASGQTALWEFICFDPSLLFSIGNEPEGANRIIPPGGFFSRQPSPVISARESPYLSFLLEQVFAEMQTKAPLHQDYIHGILLMLLTELADHLSSVRPTGKKERASSVFDALSFLHQHYNETLSIPALASLCHLSESHFRRLFRETAKTSPLEYLHTIRIHTACRYLYEGKEPIHVISALVGYSTLSSFNRQFHRHMHMSPRDWQKELYQSAP